MKHMEITYLSEDSLKIRGKHITLLINPVSISTKTQGDAALFFNHIQTTPKNAEVRLLIEGAGDYEIGGVKISGVQLGDSIYYNILFDGIDIFVSKISSLTKAKDSLREYEVVLLQSNAVMEQAIVTAFNPNVFVFWGSQATENIKSLGKEDITGTSKFIITREKLPSETQIVLLQ